MLKRICTILLVGGISALLGLAAFAILIMFSIFYSLDVESPLMLLILIAFVIAIKIAIRIVQKSVFNIDEKIIDFIIDTIISFLFSALVFFVLITIVALYCIFDFSLQDIPH